MNDRVYFSMPFDRHLSGNEVLETYFSLLHAETDLATNDPTGQVRSGSITVNGPTFEAEFIDTVMTSSKDEGNCSHLRFGLLLTKSGQEIRQYADTEAIVRLVYFDIPDNPLRTNGKKIVILRRIKCIHMARKHCVWRDYVYLHVRFEEYAMVVRQLTSTTFQRIGMIIQGWVSDNQQVSQYPHRVWEEHFNLFTDGGVTETVTIV